MAVARANDNTVMAKYYYFEKSYCFAFDLTLKIHIFHIRCSIRADYDTRSLVFKVVGAHANLNCQCVCQ